MDTFAQGLEVAQRLRDKSGLAQHKPQRYASFDEGDGARFEQGELDLAALRDLAENGGEPESRSGKQEWCENVINQYL